jgi:hypothetical protein
MKLSANQRERCRRASDPEYKERKNTNVRNWREKKRNDGTLADYQYAEHLKKRYGLTLADYDALLAEQGGVCAICRSPPTSIRLAVDHCHATGTVRGLLCTNCNQAIGKLNDSPELLRSAINYLNKGHSMSDQPTVPEDTPETRPHPVLDAPFDETELETHLAIQNEVDLRQFYRWAFRRQPGLIRRFNLERHNIRT